MPLIKTLQDFYLLMFETKGIRAEITEKYLNNDKISAQLINPLRDALENLTSLPQQEDGTYQVILESEKTINLDLRYELSELEKDLFFLHHSEDEFYSHLEDVYENFLDEINQGVASLQGINFKNFITDRDGTINNYCARYISSIQSIYNAVFLTRFAKSLPGNSVILTSAPLDNVGLVDISVAPDSTFIYAGSKGREYLDTHNNKKNFPIAQEKQAKLDEINDRLKKMLGSSAYKKFTLIGSGLQLKFGQTTIARQDICKTIPEKESDNFLKSVREIVANVDPQNHFFRIEDTGKDIEIILTVENKDQGRDLKDFDKGDGIAFLNDDLNLAIDKGPCLICGDTNSDVPMVTTAMKFSQETFAIFVTTDDALKEKVKSACPNAYFVTSPDILVTILNNLGSRKG